MSKKLLGALREYYRWMRPETYLFPGTVNHSRADKPITEKVSLRNLVERAPTAIGVVRSISELRGDAKQLGNESGLRDCILFRHPSYSAFPNHMQCFDSLPGPPSG